MTTVELTIVELTTVELMAVELKSGDYSRAEMAEKAEKPKQAEMAKQAKQAQKAQKAQKTKRIPLMLPKRSRSCFFAKAWHKMAFVQDSILVRTLLLNGFPFILCEISE